MSEEVSSLKHRDQQRCNNATAAVQGCLYQNINKRCIDKLMIINNDYSSCNDEEHKKKLRSYCASRRHQIVKQLMLSSSHKKALVRMYACVMHQFNLMQ